MGKLVFLCLDVLEGEEWRGESEKKRHRSKRERNHPRATPSRAEGGKKSGLILRATLSRARAFLYASNGGKKIRVWCVQHTGASWGGTRTIPRVTGLNCEKVWGRKGGGVIHVCAQHCASPLNNQRYKSNSPRDSPDSTHTQSIKICI